MTTGAGSRCCPEPRTCRVRRRTASTSPPSTPCSPSAACAQPFIRLTRDGNVLANNRFTAAGGAGATINDQVSDTLMTDLLLDGTTVVLQALHRTWRPVTDLVTELSAELACPVQANAYITPPDSRGFDAHYDVHDVFVIQLAGRKLWQVHAPGPPAPARRPAVDHPPRRRRGQGGRAAAAGGHAGARRRALPAARHRPRRRHP